MTRTRWKLMAGGLMVALGGLAAVAGVPSRSCHPDLKTGPVVFVESPVVCGPVAVAPCPPAPTVARVIHQQPADAPVVPPVVPDPVPPSVPAVSTPAELPAIPAPTTTKEDRSLELTIPAAATEPAPPVPAPPVPAPPVPADPAPAPPAAAPPVADLPPPVQPEAARPDPLLTATPAPAQAPAVVEKKLKVMLHMGDDRPRFEVRDGDEVYLKVVCDKVDVKSPSDRGETMSVLKATGKVAFITPGGEGECEELTVMPGTGQVVVTGNVSFKYNWGKVETTVSGEKMTFRLGSAPGMAPATPTTVPASYQRTR
jgi:hypothetical protein